MIALGAAGGIVLTHNYFPGIDCVKKDPVQRCY